MPRELPTSRTGSAPSLPVAPEPYRHGVSRKPKLFQDNLFYEVPMFTDDTARSHFGHRMHARPNGIKPGFVPIYRLRSRRGIRPPGALGSGNRAACDSAQFGSTKPEGA